MYIPYDTIELPKRKGAYGNGKAWIYTGIDGKTKYGAAGNTAQGYRDMVDKLYLEKQSSKSADARPELKKMMDFVREGDIIVVESISQFARNTKDLLSLADELQRERRGLCQLEKIYRHHNAAGTVYAYGICGNGTA